MKLGIYVGSFNPVHDGHYLVCRYLIDNNYLDKVLIIPTLDYWDKEINTSLEDRINMLKYYEEEDIIIDTKHNNYKYTYQIFNALEKEVDDELYLIIGSDNLERFFEWKNVEEILKHKVIVVNRGDKITIDDDRFIIINNFPYIDISSTEIRNGKREFIKKEVIDYIDKNNLYRK